LPTGTAIAGISVERRSCRKIKTTIATSIKAIIKVSFTWLIEASKNSLELYMTLNFMPEGNLLKMYLAGVPVL
jgi:hypothetical protein